ncbi:uncharacterized protein LOC124273092 isoform X2 [Haliotis rubra]|uniref:uncharacterized protein LOC124273092 isoform X2 n=1 Tax=Haliotis rubra TaxID=36100 RepID=UPI001EE58CFB|nr:uncharacterized protein LOC124273092 isoform X2 [Haliotis rubra]
MVLLSSFFIVVLIQLGAPLPTGDLPRSDGIKPECAIYNEQNKCPPGHELIDCGDAYPGLWKCSTCKENLYQCDYVTPEYSVKCQPPSCPELGKETSVKVVDFENKTCRVLCVCNETNGYTGKSGATCSKHPVCGLDKELKNGTCVDCSPGFHNPDTEYGPCVAYETTPPSTSSPVTFKSTPRSSSSPSDQGSGQSNIIWILVPCLALIIVVVLVVFLWYCCRGQTHACNMACCNSTAIQNPNRQQDQAAEAPENPPPYTFLPNGGLSAGTGGHHQNGTSAAPGNGISNPRRDRTPW